MKENIEFGGASLAPNATPIGGKKLKENIEFGGASFAPNRSLISGEKIERK